MDDMSEFKMQPKNRKIWKGKKKKTKPQQKKNNFGENI